MFIQVLGTGCAKCAHMAVRVEEAAKRADITVTLEKVTDINKITALGVMTTPALIVDGKLKCAGNVPSVERLIAMLQEQ